MVENDSEGQINILKYDRERKMYTEDRKARGREVNMSRSHAILMSDFKCIHEYANNHSPESLKGKDTHIRYNRPLSADLASFVDRPGQKSPGAHLKVYDRISARHSRVKLWRSHQLVAVWLRPL